MKGYRGDALGWAVRTAGHLSDIADELNWAVNEVSQPEVKERLTSSGAEITPMSAEQFGTFLQSETDKYTTLVRVCCGLPF